MPKYYYDDLKSTNDRFERELLKRKMIEAQRSYGLRPKPPLLTGYGMYTAGGKYNVEEIDAACSICSNHFIVAFNKSTQKQETYLCSYCEEHYGKNTVIDALSTTQEVDELLQEAEDHFNGVVRPKKEEVQEIAAPVYEMPDDIWGSEPVTRNPYEDFLKNTPQAQQEFESNQESESQSNSSSKNKDWWKILGIILITAVVTAFFTSLLLI